MIVLFLTVADWSIRHREVGKVTSTLLHTVENCVINKKQSCPDNARTTVYQTVGAFNYLDNNLFNPN